MSKIRKNHLSGAGQVPGIPDKRSSTVYHSNVGMKLKVTFG
jgi:hypothetical protein